MAERLDRPHEELVQLPDEREGRRSRRRWLAILLSLLVHVFLVGVLFVLPGRLGTIEPRIVPQADPPANFETMPIIFTDQKVKVEEKKAPDTNVIGEKNAVARSPGEGPPTPHGEDEMPRPDAGAPGRPGANVPAEPPTPEPEPQQQADAPQGEPSDYPRTPAEETAEEKRRRVASALGRLGSSGGGGNWGDLAGEPSSGIGFSWGGGGMQIESRSDIDWGPWAEKVRQEVKDNWYSIMPVAARVGMKGAVVVHFRVQRDGTITDYEVREATGTPPLDQAVNDALLRMSSPLPPLPLPADSDEDSIGVTYMFTYNLEDERELRAWRRQNWQRQRAQRGG